MDLLVNACDPDREGEAIFRRIIHHAGVNKPTRRLWVASLEEEAIRQALAAMKPEGDYRGLADSAMNPRALPQVGATVKIKIDPAKMHLFAPSTELRLN